MLARKSLEKSEKQLRDQEHKMRLKVKIYRSNTSIEAQLIDKGKTILGKKFKFVSGKKPIEQAMQYGTEFGKLVKEKKVDSISFDRNNAKYHGKVKSFAEGMRSAGLDF